MEQKTEMAKIEAETTQHLLDVLCDGSGNLPASIAAGALMRASVLLASEMAGPHRAPDVCRTALENVLNELETETERSIQ